MQTFTSSERQAGAPDSQAPDRQAPIGQALKAASHLNGGAERDRTADLRSAIAALSQLSYGPVPAKEQAKQ
jgi:hypothetical protein